MKASLKLPRVVGETTITGKNQISLPAKSMKELGWERGDHLIVEIVDDDTLLLFRRPTDWADWAGRLDHVFGTGEEALSSLERERESWNREAPRDDSQPR